ncbi:MAG: ribonuclease J [Proteobacteria bacterium]|nr:ribonuclease J [Pseudomonadota bacterium]
MQNDALKVIPLGGLGEIGMNAMVFETHSDMVLIDCGLQFPDASYPGVEVLVPDLSYVLERLEKLRGIVVTHGHDDHIGAIPFLLREKALHIWATPFPQGLIQHKLTEFPGTHEAHFHVIEPRKKFRVGEFEFDPIPVQHSIIEALAFAVKTPAGIVIHSGDFKHDPKETSRGEITFRAFEEYGDQGVALLLSDSTNAEREGHTLSEVDIEKSFERILSQQSGRLIIALFASNIRRVERILALAKKNGKKVAFMGRSMHSYTRLAFEQNSLSIPEDTVILIENLGQYKDEEVVVLATGSQAEPRSALVRVAEGIHKDLKIKKNDTIVMSSRFIPGNERAITRMIDNLYRSGADVLYESVHQIHVSGHGFQEELLMMLKATRPQFFIPIHGEFRHLSKHAKLAKRAGVQEENVLVIEDGQAVELCAGRMRLAERFEIQKLPAVDNLFVDGSREALQQKHALAKAGIVFVALFRDEKTGELLSDPVVSTQGLLLYHGEEESVMIEGARAKLIEVNDEFGNRDDFVDIVKLETRRYFRKHVSYKPVVIPVVMDCVSQMKRS